MARSCNRWAYSWKVDCASQSISMEGHFPSDWHGVEISSIASIIAYFILFIFYFFIKVWNTLNFDLPTFSEPQLNFRCSFSLWFNFVYFFTFLFCFVLFFSFSRLVSLMICVCLMFVFHRLVNEMVFVLLFPITFQFFI